MDCVIIIVIYALLHAVNLLLRLAMVVSGMPYVYVWLVHTATYGSARVIIATSCARHRSIFSYSKGSRS